MPKTTGPKQARAASSVVALTVRNGGVYERLARSVSRAISKRGCDDLCKPACVLIRDRKVGDVVAVLCLTKTTAPQDVKLTDSEPARVALLAKESAYSEGSGLPRVARLGIDHERRVFKYRGAPSKPLCACHFKLVKMLLAASPQMLRRRQILKAFPDLRRLELPNMALNARVYRLKQRLPKDLAECLLPVGDKGYRLDLCRRGGCAAGVRAIRRANFKNGD